MSALESTVQPVPEPPLAKAWSGVLLHLRQHLASSTQDMGPLPGGAGALIAPLLEEPRFVWLMDTFGLGEFEAAALVIVIAPELDPQVKRRYAALRPDLAHARPDGAMCLALLCDSFAEQLSALDHFTWDAPLFRHRLVNLIEPMPRGLDPVRCAALAPDPQILRTLCYGQGLDPRLARFCRLLQAGEARPPEDGEQRRLNALVAHASSHRTPLQLVFQGPTGSGRRDAALALAANRSARLLVADLAYAYSLGDFAELVTPLFREAWLQDALLYFEGLDTLMETTPLPELQRFLDDLADDGGISIIASSKTLPWNGRRPLAAVTIEFGAHSIAKSLQLWRDTLSEQSPLSEGEITILAGRYQLGPAQIRAAATTARHLARLQNRRASKPLFADFASASRAQGSLELSKLARKVGPVHQWDDLVLPPDARRQLHEICARLEHNAQVFEAWGFGARLSLGKGTSALFAGGSGTGKTMATEVIASELGLDLYKIDLATVVSKYIGETEKNLDRIFVAAKQTNAILFFDEADAIFGKRSEVRDAHDRYANLEIAYLLQKMEEHEGLAILATNLKQNLDDAFLRRLTYTVLFPFPDAADRERIWRRIWPGDTPLADDIDFTALAARFKLSGGNIKNAALAAAFFAASDREPVAMRHLVHGVRRELQKAGKTLGELDPRTLEALAPVSDDVVRYG
ncbi:MAG: ATP-binding protein [Lysobacter sp.]|nr:ATP-binding protein [Lysobacter sp.]